MGKKYTIENVKDFAKEQGYEVLDEIYIDIKTKMKFKCLKCGEIVDKSLDTFKTYHNCSNCKNIELNNKYDNILNNILDICKKYNKIIPISKLKDYGINVSKDNINNILHKKNYKTYHDFCINYNIYGEYDVIINNQYISNEKLTIEDLKLLWQECKEKYNVILGAELCNKYLKEWHIPSWLTIQNVLKKNNYTLYDFYTYIGINCHFKDLSKYDLYLDKFIKVSNETGRHLMYNELENNKWNLPGVKWFIDNCPNKNIKNYNQFIDWIGFIPNYNVSKDTAIKAIINMQSKLNRPLMYDDFRSPNPNEVGIGTINKIWGSMNKMKSELKLEIIQEDMICKNITLEQAKEDIKKLCNYIYNTENRKTITTTDTSKIDGLLNFGTYRKYLKDNNENIKDYIKSIGFELQKEGRGLIYNFEDGEITKSKYELEFSKYLRDKLNLKYNVDYFRDVRYKTFINNYNNLMDCDYIINYKGRKIYIEIAGLLRDYDKYYYNNKIINSKSKEKYRLKLMKKEEMLKSIDCEYYILFPINKNYKSIIDFDFINGIFNKNN